MNGEKPGANAPAVPNAERRRRHPDVAILCLIAFFVLSLLISYTHILNRAEAQAGADSPSPGRLAPAARARSAAREPDMPEDAGAERYATRDDGISGETVCEVEVDLDEIFGRGPRTAREAADVAARTGGDIAHAQSYEVGIDGWPGGYAHTSYGYNDCSKWTTTQYASGDPIKCEKKGRTVTSYVTLIINFRIKKGGIWNKIGGKAKIDAQCTYSVSNYGGTQTSLSKGWDGDAYRYTREVKESTETKNASVTAEMKDTVTVEFKVNSTYKYDWSGHFDYTIGNANEGWSKDGRYVTLNHKPGPSGGKIWRAWINYTDKNGTVKTDENSDRKNYAGLLYDYPTATTYGAVTGGATDWVNAHSYTVVAASAETLKVDNGAPSFSSGYPRFSASTSGGAISGPVKANVYLCVKLSDSGGAGCASGISEVTATNGTKKYSIAPRINSGDFSVKIPIDKANGTWSVTATDKAGNSVTKNNLEFKWADWKAPVISDVKITAVSPAYVDGDGKNWTKDKLLLAFKVTDATGDASGYQQAAGVNGNATAKKVFAGYSPGLTGGGRITMKNGNPASEATSIAFSNLEVHDDYAHMTSLTIEATDRAGNAISASYKYGDGKSVCSGRLDKTAPSSCGITADKGTDSWTHEDATIKLTAKETGGNNDGSGLKRFAFYATAEGQEPKLELYDGDAAHKGEYSITAKDVMEKTAELKLIFDTFSGMGGFEDCVKARAYDNVGNASEEFKLGGIKRDTFVPQAYVEFDFGDGGGYRTIAATNGAGDGNSGKGLNYALPWRTGETRIRAHCAMGAAGGALTCGDAAHKGTIPKATGIFENAREYGAGFSGENKFESKSATGKKTYAGHRHSFQSGANVFEYVEYAANESKTIEISATGTNGIQTPIVTIEFRIDITAPTLTFLGLSESSASETDGAPTLMDIDDFLNKDAWARPTSGLYAIFEATDGDGSGVMTDPAKNHADCDDKRGYGEREAGGKWKVGNSGTQETGEYPKTYKSLAGDSLSPHDDGFDKRGAAYMNFLYDKSFDAETPGQTYEYSEFAYAMLHAPEGGNPRYLLQFKFFDLGADGMKKAPGFFKDGEYDVASTSANGTFLRHKVGISDFCGNVAYCAIGDAIFNKMPNCDKSNVEGWGKDSLRFYVDPFEEGILSCAFYQAKLSTWNKDEAKGSEITESALPLKTYGIKDADKGWARNAAIAKIEFRHGISPYELECFGATPEATEGGDDERAFAAIKGVAKATRADVIYSPHDDHREAWAWWPRGTRHQRVAFAFGCKGDPNKAVTLSRPEHIVRQDASPPRLEEAFVSTKGSYAEAKASRLLTFEFDADEGFRLKRGLVPALFGGDGTYVDDSTTPLPGFPAGYFASDGAGGYAPATGARPAVGERYFVAASPALGEGETYFFLDEEAYAYVRVRDASGEDRGAGIREFDFAGVDGYSKAVAGVAFGDGFAAGDYVNVGELDELPADWNATFDGASESDAYFVRNAGGAYSKAPSFSKSATYWARANCLVAGDGYYRSKRKHSYDGLTGLKSLKIALRDRIGNETPDDDKHRYGPKGAGGAYCLPILDDIDPSVALTAAKIGGASYLSSDGLLSGAEKNGDLTMTLACCSGGSGLRLWLREYPFEDEWAQDARLTPNETGHRLPENFDWKGFGIASGGKWIPKGDISDESSHPGYFKDYSSALLPAAGVGVRSNASKDWTHDVTIDLASVLTGYELLAVSGAGRYYYLNLGKAYIDKEAPQIHRGMTMFAVGDAEPDADGALNYSDLRRIWSRVVEPDAPYSSGPVGAYWHITDSVSGMDEDGLTIGGAALNGEDRRKITVKGVPLINVKIGGADPIELTIRDLTDPIVGAAYWTKTAGGHKKATEAYVDGETTPLPGFPNGYYLRSGEGTAASPHIYSPASNPTFGTSPDGYLTVDGYKAYDRGGKKYVSAPADSETVARADTTFRDIPMYRLVSASAGATARITQAKDKAGNVSAETEAEAHALRIDPTPVAVGASIGYADGTAGFEPDKFTNKSVRIEWTCDYGASGFGGFGYKREDKLSVAAPADGFIAAPRELSTPGPEARKLKIRAVKKTADGALVWKYGPTGEENEYGQSVGAWVEEMKKRDPVNFGNFDLGEISKFEFEFAPASGGGRATCRRVFGGANCHTVFSSIAGYNGVLSEYASNGARPADVAADALSAKIDVVPPTIDTGSGNFGALSDVCAFAEPLKVKISDDLSGVGRNGMALASGNLAFDATISLGGETGYLVPPRFLDRKIDGGAAADDLFYSFALGLDENDLSKYAALGLYRLDRNAEYSVVARDEAGNEAKAKLTPNVDAGIARIVSASVRRGEDAYAANAPATDWVRDVATTKICWSDEALRAEIKATKPRLGLVLQYRRGATESELSDAPWQNLTNDDGALNDEAFSELSKTESGTEAEFGFLIGNEPDATLYAYYAFRALSGAEYAEFARRRDEAKGKNRIERDAAIESVQDEIERRFPPEPEYVDVGPTPELPDDWNAERNGAEPSGKYWVRNGDGTYSPAPSFVPGATYFAAPHSVGPDGNLRRAVDAGRSVGLIAIDKTTPKAEISAKKKVGDGEFADYGVLRLDGSAIEVGDGVWANAGLKIRLGDVGRPIECGPSGCVATYRISKDGGATWTEETLLNCEGNQCYPYAKNADGKWAKAKNENMIEVTETGGAKMSGSGKPETMSYAMATLEYSLDADMNNELYEFAIYSGAGRWVKYGFGAVRDGKTLGLKQDTQKSALAASAKDTLDVELGLAEAYASGETYELTANPRWSPKNRIIAKIEVSGIGPSGVTLYRKKIIDGAAAQEEAIASMAPGGASPTAYFAIDANGETKLSVYARSGAGRQSNALSCAMRLDNSVPIVCVTEIDGEKASNWGRADNLYGLGAEHWYVSDPKMRFAVRIAENGEAKDRKPYSGYKFEWKRDGTDEWIRDERAEREGYLTLSGKPLVENAGYSLRITSGSGLSCVLGDGISAGRDNADATRDYQNLCPSPVIKAHAEDGSDDGSYRYVFSIDSAEYSLERLGRLDLGLDMSPTDPRPLYYEATDEFVAQTTLLRGADGEYAEYSGTRFRHGDRVRIEYASKVEDGYFHNATVTASGKRILRHNLTSPVLGRAVVADTIFGPTAVERMTDGTTDLRYCVLTDAGLFVAVRSMPVLPRDWNAEGNGAEPSDKYWVRNADGAYSLAQSFAPYADYERAGYFEAQFESSNITAASYFAKEVDVAYEEGKGKDEFFLQGEPAGTEHRLTGKAEYAYSMNDEEKTLDVPLGFRYDRYETDPNDPNTLIESWLEGASPNEIGAYRAVAFATKGSFRVTASTATKDFAIAHFLEYPDPDGVGTHFEIRDATDFARIDDPRFSMIRAEGAVDAVDRAVHSYLDPGLKYVLLSDLFVSTGLTGEFRGEFDGRGKLLTVPGGERVDDFGIFDSVGAGGLVRGLSVRPKTRTEINAGDAALKFGLVAKTLNGGTISDASCVGDFGIISMGPGSAFGGAVATIGESGGELRSIFSDIRITNAGRPLRDARIGGVLGEARGDARFDSIRAFGETELYNVEDVDAGLIWGLLRSGSHSAQYSQYLKTSAFVNSATLIGPGALESGASISGIAPEPVEHDVALEWRDPIGGTTPNVEIMRRLYADFGYAYDPDKPVEAQARGTGSKARPLKIGRKPLDGEARECVDEHIRALNGYMNANFVFDESLTDAIDMSARVAPIAVTKVFHGSLGTERPDAYVRFARFGSGLNAMTGLDAYDGGMFGLFGQLNGRVGNITFSDISLDFELAGESDCHIGLVAAKSYSEAKIDNVILIGAETVRRSAPGGRLVVGGLVGRAEGTAIGDVFSVNNISARASRPVVGGIAGEASGLIFEGATFLLGRVEVGSGTSYMAGAAVGLLDEGAPLTPLDSAYAIKDNVYWGGSVKAEKPFGSTDETFGIRAERLTRDYMNAMTNVPFANGVKAFEKVYATAPGAEKRLYPLLGNGGDDCPFIVSDESDFKHINLALYANYLLTSDIEFSNFETIGVGLAFSGRLTGKEGKAADEGEGFCSLSNLTAPLVERNKGMIGMLSLVANCEFDVSLPEFRYGAVALKNEGVIRDVTVSGSVNIVSSDKDATLYVSGFVAECSGGAIDSSDLGKLQNSISALNIRVGGVGAVAYVGGYAATVSGGATTFSYGLATGSIVVDGMRSTYAGLLAGQASGLTVTNNPWSLGGPEAAGEYTYSVTVGGATLEKIESNFYGVAFGV